MKHFEKLTIEMFRGLKNAEFHDLGEVNLFVGNNNSGKTSALEAIELLSNPFSAKNYYNISRLRDHTFGFPRGGRLPFIDSLLWMFPLNSEKNRDPIKFSAIIKNQKIDVGIHVSEEVQVKLEADQTDENTQFNLFDEDSPETIKILNLEVNRNGEINRKTKSLLFREDNLIIRDLEDEDTLKSTMITPIDHRSGSFSVRKINDAIISGDKPRLISALRLFDNNIKGLELLLSNNRNTKSLLPYIDHEELGLVPIMMFGDGLRKALTVASALIESQNGIILIDEIETAVHTSVLGEFFSWLIEACKMFKVQLFATTHSLEAIDGIISASKKDDYNLVVYRLSKNNKTTAVKRFSSKTISSLRFELGQDVR
ncbi:AAA family ATPase [Pullulanibacillus sp. KACC 23026]|uniref:AAA family ATPase n=1 Tax=Pullulanibacillus sp. KACC 23026 TaxID=3028315 RepID=UPI0023B02100|nr:AAA family ATPase [Pullulanibacillus sp. KACC 23026]WEG13433.1 AAA family ATPase [Pullulanibacillus sp. KACC 23026]